MLYKTVKYSWDTGHDHEASTYSDHTPKSLSFQIGKDLNSEAKWLSYARPHPLRSVSNQ